MEVWNRKKDMNTSGTKNIDSSGKRILSNVHLHDYVDISAEVVVASNIKD